MLKSEKGIDRSSTGMAWCWLLFALAAVAMHGGSNASPIQDAAPSHIFQRLDVVAHPECFEEIASRLSFTEAQYDLATRHYEQYWQDIVALDADLNERIQNAGEKRARELDEARFYRKHEVSQDEIDALMASAGEARLTGLRQSDARLETFFGEVEKFLSEQQRERLPEAWRIVCRHSFFNWAEAQGQWGDFNWPIDLIRLVEDAKKSGNELHGLAEPLEPADLAVEASCEALQRILMEWEESIDPSINEKFMRSRIPAPSREQSQRIDPGDPRYERGIRHWVVRFEATKVAVDKIAAIAKRCAGVSASEAWQQRFRRSLAPELHRQYWPEEMVAWVTAQPGATPELQIAAQQLFDAYAQRRDVLIRDAFAAGVVAKHSHWSLQDISDLTVDYFRKLYAYRELIQSTIATLRGNLTPAQADVLDGTMLVVRSEGGEGFGPYVPSTMIEAMGEVPPPRGVLILYDPVTGQRVTDPDFSKD